ncbi:hypothetical protein MED121_15589 [Marinomonas sp. MED121]|uniref:hypothetical protein n=1 Tax=Marinomonas sp. MED121 TaxID=314277 RepID=UPI00006910F3|nr:hypothetical protein [Marinomonas sp. MED121]EAQ67363.1 hypothetical protein MED121_15589 [Marinomonas sp. MED121]
MNFNMLGLLSLIMISFFSFNAQAKSSTEKEMYDLRVDISVMEKKLHSMGIDVNINEVPKYGSQYLQDHALRSKQNKLRKMIENLD